jgi:hypothetical protein
LVYMSYQRFPGSIAAKCLSSRKVIFFIFSNVTVMPPSMLDAPTKAA